MTNRAKEIALVLVIGLAFVLLTGAIQAATGWSSRQIGAGGLLLLGTAYLTYRAIRATRDSR